MLEVLALEARTNYAPKLHLMNNALKFFVKMSLCQMIADLILIFEVDIDKNQYFFLNCIYLSKI